MKKVITYTLPGLLAIFLFFTKTLHGQKGFIKLETSTDSSYGYTAKNPLKLKNGNQAKSMTNSYNFLSGIRTQDNQTLKLLSRVIVSDPGYKEPAIKINNRATGLPISGKLGMLDKYVFLTTNTNDTITLYIDIYNKEKLFLPIGLKYEPLKK
jgi:hypothetical protein